MKMRIQILVCCLVVLFGANASAAEQRAFHAQVRVIDESGVPVPTATIRPRMVADVSETRWTSRTGLPETITADESGAFELVREEPFIAVQVEIHADNVAPMSVAIKQKEGVQEVAMSSGVTVTGRITGEGEPVVGYGLVLENQNLAGLIVLGPYITETNDEGIFVFEHLPPDGRWYLHGAADSIKEQGVFTLQSVTTSSSRETVDLGEITVSDGLHLSGRVVAAEGQPEFEKFEFNVGDQKLQTNFDPIRVETDSEGRFEVTGLYRGQVVQIDSATRNWGFTRNNRSLEEWNSWRLVGIVEENHPEIIFEVETGARRRMNEFVNANGNLPGADRSENRPLRGIERTGGAFIQVTGTVFDEESGKPLKAFELVPGRKPPAALTRPVPSNPSLIQRLAGSFQDQPTNPWEQTWWDGGRVSPEANGVFEIEFELMSSTPVIQIRARGYQPFISSEISSSTNLTIQLEKGKGPNGTVQFPDGSPAEGARISYAGGNQQISLDEKGEMRIMVMGSDTLAEIGADGRFQFEPRSELDWLFVSHEKGWASVEVSEYRNGGRIRLKEWASVKGVLVDANGKPVPGEILNITTMNRLRSGKPYINIGSPVTTDGQGNFQFSFVPPEDMELVRMVPMVIPGQTGTGPTYYSHQLQTPLELRPGETLDLGEMTIDSPPPPSVLERVQEKLGL